MTEKNHITTIRLPEPLWTRLQAVAEHDTRSARGLIVVAVTQYVNRAEKRVQRAKGEKQSSSNDLARRRS